MGLNEIGNRASIELLVYDVRIYTFSILSFHNSICANRERLALFFSYGETLQATESGGFCKGSKRLSSMPFAGQKSFLTLIQKAGLYGSYDFLVTLNFPP